MNPRNPSDKEKIPKIKKEQETDKNKNENINRKDNRKKAFSQRVPELVSE